MIIQLRRRHYYTWLILAVLLPILVLLAYFNIPENAESNFNRQGILPYEKVLKSKKTDDLEAKIRVNSKQNFQLELTILKPIEGAANQVFVANSSQKTSKVLIGSIESTGVYRFPLPDSLGKSPISLIIFDVIKQKEILKIEI